MSSFVKDIVPHNSFYIRGKGRKRTVDDCSGSNLSTSLCHFDIIESKTTHKSDCSRFSYKLVAVSKDYSIVSGDYYTFTNIELDGYSYSMGIILYDRYYNDYFRYVFEDEQLFSIEAKRYGNIDYNKYSGSVPNAHQSFIYEVVNKLKTKTQNQSGPRLVRK